MYIRRHPLDAHTLAIVSTASIATNNPIFINLHYELASRTLTCVGKLGETALTAVFGPPTRVTHNIGETTSRAVWENLHACAISDLVRLVTYLERKQKRLDSLSLPEVLANRLWDATA